MSLLLDALHRASKDKEKAVVAAALSEPAPAPEELRLSDTGSVGVSFPPLAPEPTLSPGRELTQELVLDPAPALQWEPVEPQLAPVPVPVQASAAVLPTQADVTPGWEVAAASAPTVAKVESLVEPPAPKSSSTAHSPSKPEANPDRVAKEIRRAYVPDATSFKNGKRRVFFLGGIAVALVAGMASVFLGVWGDPALLLTLGSTSSLAPVAPIAAPAEPTRVSDEPAPVASAVQPPGHVEPVAQPVQRRLPSKSPPPQSAASSPLPAPAAVAPALSLSGNEVVVRGVSSKPGFVPRTMGPNLLELGYSALLDGRLDDAARLYRQALAASAEERDALLGLAYIAYQKGSREEAQGYYHRVLRQEPGNTIANAGLLALDSEADTQVSSSRARELAARQPGSAATMATAGSAMVRDGRLADAAKLFASAQMLEPDNPLHAYNHAVALDRLGQYGVAQVQYENVLKLSEKTPPVSRPAFSLEAVRQRLGQLRQALGSSTGTDK